MPYGFVAIVRTAQSLRDTLSSPSSSFSSASSSSAFPSFGRSDASGKVTYQSLVIEKEALLRRQREAPLYVTSYAEIESGSSSSTTTTTTSPSSRLLVIERSLRSLAAPRSRWQIVRSHVARLLANLLLSVTFLLPTLIVVWNIYSLILSLVSSVLSLVYEVQLPWSGMLPTILSLLGVVYVVISCIIGFSTLPWLTVVRLLPAKTPLHIILAEAFLFLLVSSSLPAVTSILGLINLSLVRQFSANVYFLAYPPFLILYRTAFIFLTFSRYSEHFPVYIARAIELPLALLRFLVRTCRRRRSVG